MVKVKGPFKGKVTMRTPEGQVWGWGGTLGHRTKGNDHKSTTWESDRASEYQREKKTSHKDQSSSRQLRSSYRSHRASGVFPAWRKPVNKLTKEILGPPQTATEQDKTEGFREVQCVRN